MYLGLRVDRLFNPGRTESFDFRCAPQSLRLFDTELFVDAKSLFTAFSAVVVREPAEKTCGVLLFLVERTNRPVPNS